MELYRIIFTIVRRVSAFNIVVAVSAVFERSFSMTLAVMQSTACEKSAKRQRSGWPIVLALFKRERGIHFPIDFVIVSKLLADLFMSVDALITSPVRTRLLAVSAGGGGVVGT